MDTLTLKNVRISGKHGVFEHEKVQGNTFEIDLIFKGDFARPGDSDQLAHTIDYSEAATIIKEVIHGASVNLIEKLAHRLLHRLQTEFSMADAITVRLRKLNPPMEPAAEWAEIETSWTKSS
jgi:dihydroneopterin aldolase